MLRSMVMVEAYDRYLSSQKVSWTPFWLQSPLGFLFGSWESGETLLWTKEQACLSIVYICSRHRLVLFLPWKHCQIEFLEQSVNIVGAESFDANVGRQVDRQQLQILTYSGVSLPYGISIRTYRRARRICGNAPQDQISWLDMPCDDLADRHQPASRCPRTCTSSSQ